MKDNIELPRFLRKDLPNDLYALIVGYLTLWEVNALIQYKLISNDASSNNSFWAKQLQKYFPHIGPAANNYALFKQAYQSVPSDYKKLFFYLKEGNWVDFKKNVSNLNSLDSKSKCVYSTGKILGDGFFLQWLQLQRDKTLLNDLYQIIETYYQSPELVIDYKKTDCVGRNLLYWAVQCRQDLKTIQPIIDDQHVVYFSEVHIIYVAIQQGLLEVVDYFLTRFPAWLNQDISNITPLTVAIHYNQELIVEALLNHNVFISEKPDVLTMAIDNKAVGIVVKLVQAGAKVGAWHIRCVIRTGQLELLKCMLEKHPHMIECTNECDETPLLWAIEARNDDLVEYLLSKNANVNVKKHHNVWYMKFTHTPISIALYNGLSFALLCKLNHLTVDKNSKISFVEKFISLNPTVVEQMQGFGVVLSDLLHERARFLFGPDKQLYLVNGVDGWNIKPDARFHKMTCTQAIDAELFAFNLMFDAYTPPNKACNILMHKGILELYQPESRLELFKFKNHRGDTLLHDALDDLVSFKMLMLLIPIEQRLEAVNILNKRGSSVLHFALEFSDEVLRTILPLLLPQHRLIAVRTPNRFGKPFIDAALDDLDLFKWIMSLLPEEQHGKVLQHTNYTFFKSNQELAKPSSESDDLLFSMSP